MEIMLVVVSNHDSELTAFLIWLLVHMRCSSYWIFSWFCLCSKIWYCCINSMPRTWLHCGRNNRCSTSMCWAAPEGETWCCNIHDIGINSFFFKGKFLHNYLPTVTLIYYHTDEVVNLPNYWLLQLYNSVFIELFPSVSWTLNYLRMNEVVKTIWRTKECIV